MGRAGFFGWPNNTSGAGHSTRTTNTTSTTSTSATSSSVSSNATPPQQAVVTVEKELLVGLSQEALCELQCGVCHEVPSNPLETPCGHLFCRLCLQTWTHKHNNCPTCRHHLSRKSVDRLCVCSSSLPASLPP